MSPRQCRRLKAAATLRVAEQLELMTDAQIRLFKQVRAMGVFSQLALQRQLGVSLNPDFAAGWPYAELADALAAATLSAEHLSYCPEASGNVGIAYIDTATPLALHRGGTARWQVRTDNVHPDARQRARELFSAVSAADLGAARRQFEAIVCTMPPGLWAEVTEPAA